MKSKATETCIKLLSSVVTIITEFKTNQFINACMQIDIKIWKTLFLSQNHLYTVISHEK